MEAQAAPQPNKKLFIGSIIVMLLLFIISIIIVITSRANQAPVSNPNQQTAGNPNLPNSQDINTTQGASPTEQINTYKNSQFSINYPAGWGAEESIAADGEKSVYIKLNSDIKNPFTNSMTITIGPSGSIAPRQQFFVSQGFSSDFIPLDGLSAVRLRGSFPKIGKLASQSANLNIMQETHIYLDRGNYSYLLVYKYKGAGINSQAESNFAKMVSSFKFVQ